MEIKKTSEGGTLTVALLGRLDTTTAPQLEAVLKHSVEGVTELIFDFQELEYLSSAGLRIMMAADKVMSRQGTMKLVSVNEEVMEVFEMTGLSEILQIEEQRN